MLRHAAVLILGLAALTLAPGAPGLPDVPGDPTPPVVTPVITGTLGSASWYTSNVTVSWSIVDPESTIFSTTGCNTVTFTTNTTGTPLSCTAESDGGTTTVGKMFRVDKSAPSTTATPSRSADANGWYNHDLTVDFAGTDTTSGLESCSPDAGYGGPDTAGTIVSGTCRDVAGNTAPANFPLKYDETAPQASPAARAPDANGWFNHAVTVAFQGADGTSGIASCTQVTYAGPDDPSAVLSGTCLDVAGNQSPSAAFTLKYDETLPAATATPSRPADVNGWHNHSLTVTFAGSDATSGLDSCDAPKAYSGPDAAAAAVTGSCRDLAGNVAPRSFALKYDATAPATVAAPSRQPNANGWYAAPLTVSFAGNDATSGIASCAAPKNYAGPDASAASLAGSCTDQAGNAGAASFPLKYDATAPQTTATPGRVADRNGWYNHALAVTFAGTDATSGIDSCDPAKSYSGPDASSASVSGSCRDRAGNSTAGSFALAYDATQPQVSAAPSRQPNAAGWFNAPLNVTFAGTDAMSGVESCDPVKTYAGPDSASTAVAGSCSDRAGNGGGASFGLKYDATAPASSATPSRQPNANGWFNAPLSLSFGATDATSTVDSCDAAKSYSGPDVVTTTISGVCRDKAGNASSASYAVKYDATAPATSAVAARQPNGNGWYNAPLGVTFSATDATSTVDSCEAPKTYSGPDSGAAAVSGTCTDKAGNADSASLPIKYDATAPAATASPSRQPNANGWFNAPLTVSFAATDATSTVDSCDAAKGYSGPDVASAAVTGTCRDKAGNTGPASYLLKYDATVPQTTATPDRQPNANGWYKAALIVGFTATDAMSTVDSCDAAKTYAGPDTATASVAGACRDKAGNSASASLPLKYDATAPATSATPARQPNAQGWYNAALQVSFAATDATSTVDSCEAAKTYAGPDSGSASVTGTCLDKAGNLGATSFPLKYDATAPAATASPSRQPNANGWFNAPLSVGFTATDATSTVDSCDAAKSYSGPDVASTAVAGTCRDKAGNAASASYSVKYDATAPQTTATPNRQPNANGWYNTALSVHFAAIDATSTVESCDADKTYSGPDSASAAVAGTCRDKAGNAGSASFAVKYDATLPQVTATPARPADRNGWYSAPLSVSFTGGDATSGVAACAAPKSYSGPDSSSTAVAGTCTDRAGNVGTGSLPLKYDATAPQATAGPSRAANANGWFNAPLSVVFSATDATSGVDSCPAAQGYSGPDDAAAVVSGTCVDLAGNSGPASFVVRYDTTAPQATATPRRPARNGWFSEPLTVDFTGADQTSGVETCTGPKGYAGPDTTGSSLTGSCSDRAGNQSAVAEFDFAYDATAPLVDGAVAVRGPDRAGWYNHPVSFAVQGSDATSGIEACPTISYGGPDGAGAEVAAACTDRAGNRATRPFPLRYDATGPATHAAPDRAPDGNGWYNRPLTVGFSGTDAVSGLEACDGARSYNGPDGDQVAIGGVCLDKAGNVGLASLPVRYDATAPLVAGASPSRPPDRNGWYNRPLVVAFHGLDATSQIASCTESAYAGPDADGAFVTGSCRDRAGNPSAEAAFSLRFDATAPSLTGVRAKAGNRTARLSWTASPDTTRVEIRRAGKLVYRGTGSSFTDTGLKNAVRYRYTLAAFDEAGNDATTSVSVRPTAPLFAPAAGATVSAPPRLAWVAAEKATYYHVQVWRRGRILSAWPKGTSFRLRRSWTYAGRRYRLTPGRYTWHVWPGYGRRAEKNFGRLLGSSSFVVR